MPTQTVSQKEIAARGLLVLSQGFSIVSPSASAVDGLIRSFALPDGSRPSGTEASLFEIAAARLSLLFDVASSDVRRERGTVERGRTCMGGGAAKDSRTPKRLPVIVPVGLRALSMMECAYVSGRRGTGGASDAPDEDAIPTKDADVLTRERDGLGATPVALASAPKLYPAESMERREAVPPVRALKLDGRFADEASGEFGRDGGSEWKALEVRLASDCIRD